METDLEMLATPQVAVNASPQANGNDSEWKALADDPLWYKDAIVYQAHVRAFYDSNGDGIGDFPGLIEKLDYLEDVGITAIWLLPFYPSPLRDDGYDISDYRNVNPAYGTLRDFRQFVREAHGRGIRVITELVVNHTSDQHPWFQAARKAPAGSRKRDYYVWSDTDQKYRHARIIFTDTETSNWTWDPVAKAYYWHRFFHHQPDLNFDNPHVRRALIKNMGFWLDMGVDGLRLDAVPYLVERDGTSCENLWETHAVLKEIRRELDARYPNRMLLAEANQWPTDVRPYFAEGDECHMAFHFPLMPRIFMAVRQEDRHPITEIMRQTPDIPENCQWAIFLRNHDELTLEMVTDEERDYMYREYCADPRMRINFGIRRRLSPLMEHSRRRMELLNSLLFSFPGTPIIYYGDEIGMGDNIYLGDRNGVRTPMQWSGDRNGGFSRADFARLYSPPIMDAVYGYQAVNVEAQQRDPSSLLNWMKRLNALRRGNKTFGRGTLSFLHPRNRKVLAYVRRYEDEIILCVANLSRFVQPAELDLSEFKGRLPVEMFGHVEFPPIGEAPYFLTLGAHNFYWFQLRRVSEPLSVSVAPAPVEPVAAEPILAIGSGWETLLEGAARGSLQRTILPEFLRRQRWFGGKSQTILAVRIAEWVTLKSGAALSFLTIVEVRYDDGDVHQYFLPIGVAAASEIDRLRQASPLGIISRLSSPQGDGVLYDALADDGLCLELLQAIETGRELSAKTGVLRAFRTAETTGQPESPETPLRITRGSTQQHNSFVFYLPRFSLKLFRRVEPGANPDLEVGRFLAEEARFDRTPKIVGGIEYQRTDGQPILLGVLQGLVHNQGNGWSHALEELQRYFERVATTDGAIENSADRQRSPAALSNDLASPAIVESMGGYLQVAERLGRRTAELHLALAKSTTDPAFSAEPFTAADFTAQAAATKQRARLTLGLLAKHADRFPDTVSEQAHGLLAERSRLFRRLDKFSALSPTVTKIRCHGNYHLGQVLRSESDFVILDFAGEPVRPLAERRAKQSPLKDVAGMIRSFDYASHTGLLAASRNRPADRSRLEPWEDRWQRWASASFLKEYRAAAAGAAFLPASEEELSTLLQFFLLDKALYELHYELDHRPDWVAIPLRGVLALLEQ